MFTLMRAIAHPAGYSKRMGASRSTIFVHHFLKAIYVRFHLVKTIDDWKEVKGVKQGLNVLEWQAAGIEK